MRAEDTLQYMADFYPQMFPTRKHALNELFCVLGNGFEWVNGELVNDNNKYVKRYKLIEEIHRAEFRNEDSWYDLHEFYQKMCEDKSNKIPIEYRFEWYLPLDDKLSNLCNYPDDIKPDWKELIEECKAMLRKDKVKI